MSFEDKLKNTLTKFFVSLLKNPKAISYVAGINMKFKDTPITTTAKMLYKELVQDEHLLFSDDPSSIFKKTIFEGLFPLEVIAGSKSGLRYLHLIYVYAVGCMDSSKAKEIINKNMRFFEKKETGVNSSNALVSTNAIVNMDSNFMDNLPPVLGQTVKDLAEKLVSDIEKKGIKPTSVSDLLMNIDIFSLTRQIEQMGNNEQMVEELKFLNINSADMSDIGGLVQKLTKKK